MVRPDNVMVQVELAAIVCIALMTKLVVELEDTPPVMHPLAYIIPVEEAKKPDGYVSVMVMEEVSAPPAEVVNENVA